MTLFLLGLPFLSYADVAETCFATSSNARCHQLNMTLLRLKEYKSSQVKKNSTNSTDCDRHLSVYHTGKSMILFILWQTLKWYKWTFAFYILLSPSLGSAVSTLSLWPRIYSRYFFISLYDQLKYTVCPPKNSKCQPVSEFWSWNLLMGFTM